MKYLITILHADSYEEVVTIDATSVEYGDNFTIFKNGKNTAMLANETILSITTEEYSFKPVQQQNTVKERNAKILKLVRRK